MSTKRRLKEQIAHNPKVNEGQLKEVLSVVRKLKKAGVEPVRYNLSAPFSRRPAKSPDQSKAVRNVRNLPPRS